MTRPAPVGLTTIAIMTSRLRVRVTLPDSALVGELMPHVLSQVGEQLTDEAERHGGWRLLRADRSALELTRSLPDQGVRDGEVLQLAPSSDERRELPYDDVVETIAEGARAAGVEWNRLATRRAALAVTAAVLVLALGVLLLCGPPWRLPGIVALCVAALLLASGVAVSRAVPDAVAGGVVAAAGLPYAFAGAGLLATSGPLWTRPTPSVVMYGSAVLVLASAVGYLGVVGMLSLFAAGLLAGCFGLVAGVAWAAGVSAAGAAALAVVVAVGLLPAYPALADRLAEASVPPLLRDPAAAGVFVPGVFGRVSRAAELLAGMLLATAVVSVAAGAALVTAGAEAGLLLTAVVAGALLSRARLFLAGWHRIPLLAGGIAAGLEALVTAVWRLDGSAGLRTLLIVMMVAVCAAVGVVGYPASTRGTAAAAGRRPGVDIADLLLLMLIPVACGVFGLYPLVAAAFGGS
ncbi:type VII secretion integral membrane protein EccD [Dactylosporangium sp. CA-092794]|uniref:type VII secretion integral membrane protein EccD n=1 Tax=Dactylosporangium sp. CA-092794 TaxID=3239929 RepID=UPI003D8A2DFD